MASPLSPEERAAIWDAAYASLSCQYTSMLVGYTGESAYTADVLPGTSTPLSSTTPVYGPTGVVIA